MSMASALALVGGTVGLLIKITVVLTLSVLWAGALGRASASTRYLVWLTSLSLILAVPILSSTLPSIGILPAAFDVRQAAPVHPVSSEGGSALEGVATGQEVGTAAIPNESTGSPAGRASSWRTLPD